MRKNLKYKFETILYKKKLYIDARTFLSMLRRICSITSLVTEEDIRSTDKFEKYINDRESGKLKRKRKAKIIKQKDIKSELFRLR